MIAVDTNVLIYACDQADPRRQTIALDLITTTRDGVLLPLVMPADGILSRAKELHLTRGASLWDSLILAACVEAGVETFYSEDLPGFDEFEGVRIVNPQAAHTTLSAMRGAALGSTTRSWPA